MPSGATSSASELCSGTCSRSGSTWRRHSSRRCSSRSRTPTMTSTGRSQRLRASAPDLWDAIILEASEESRIWRDTVRPDAEREQLAVFSPLGDRRYALGLETIYEGYLVHYGVPRLFAPPDADTALLLGDYLYAHGVARISALH